MDQSRVKQVGVAGGVGLIALGLWFWLARPEERPLLTDAIEFVTEAPEQASLPAVQSIVPDSSEPRDQVPKHPEGQFDLAAQDAANQQVVLLIQKLQPYVGERPESVHKRKILSVAQQKLLSLVENDRQALQALIDEYRSRVKSLTGEYLRQVLAELRDPEVEQLGWSLVGEQDRYLRIAGYDLLADLDIPSRQTMELAMGTLSENKDDTDLLLAAMNAMPVLSCAPSELGHVLDLLGGLTRHADSAVRSAALFKVAEWAKDEAGLAAVVGALDSRFPDDRVSAMMAIGRSPVVGENLQDRLLEQVANAGVTWEIRSLAADALERFALSDEQFAVYQAFRSEQAAVGQER